MSEKSEKVNVCFQKRKYFIGFNIALSLFATFACAFNSAWAGYLDKRLGAPIRRALSLFSSLFDFSVAERLFALSPLLIFLLFISAFFVASSRRRRAALLLSLLSVISKRLPRGPRASSYPPTEA